MNKGALTAANPKGSNEALLLSQLEQSINAKFKNDRLLKDQKITLRSVQDIQKLNELELNTSYPAIKRLYKEIAEHIKDGESRKINIPFPEVKRRIKGFLSGDTRKETWVKLEADD